jgi:hypothetical protein
MTDAAPDYDDIPGRTRQAWLRTNLGVVAVSLLAVRSLVLAGDGGWPVLLVLVPGAVFTVVAVRRGVDLRDRREEGWPTRATGVAAISLLALAAVGALIVIVA